MQTSATPYPSAPPARTISGSSLITLLALALLPSCPLTAWAARFIPVAPTFATGGVPQQVVTADVNKDGIPDLIASDDNGKVTLLLGKGNGTFASPVTIVTLPGGAPAAAVGDFNSDGVPDLAVLAKSANSIWIYVGRGDGTFASPSKTSTLASPAQIAVGDVNGDGHADVVVASTTGLSTLLGDGHGGLQPAITTSSSLRATALALGDVNGDGRLDVIIGTLDGDSEFLGLGDGRFKQNTNTVDVGGFSIAQAVLVDLDGDGNLDLVVAPQTGFTRGLLLSINISWGNGDGTFQTGTSLPAGTSESGVVVGDFNNDGRPDLAAANSGSNSVSILLNQGGRKFAPAVSYRTNKLDFTSLPNLLTSADFNGDGRPDLAIATVTGIQVIRNVGGGKLFAPGAIELGGTGSPLFAVSLNGDAHRDIVVEAFGVFDIGSTQVLYGDGTGQFPQRFSGPGSYPGYQGLAVGDFNGDGRLDLAYGGDSGSGSILLNSGANSFANGPSIDGFNPVAGDFNNDGFSDLVISDPSTSNIVLYLNHGDGTFGAVSSYAGGMVKAMDINKDGKRDLILTDDQRNQVTVLLGNGNGTFQPARLSTVSQIPSGFTVGDFNRDGKLDVAVALDKSIEVLLGRGDGTFAPGTSYAAPTGVNSLLQTDLRHDDKEDLLFTDGQLLWVMYGNGNGSFQAPMSYDVGPNPIWLTVGDFNEDGAPDVAVSEVQSSALALLLNTGGTRISLKSSAASVHVGQPVTFTATVVASVSGIPVPTGTVAFKDGPKGIGFVHLSNGKATFATSALSLGTHTITASYWETSSFNPHVSSPITEQILP
jgi:hypothetical protein